MFMWPTPSLSHRFYANEMLMHIHILRFAPKAVQIGKTNLLKFTKKEAMNINLQIFEAIEETCQCCQRVQNMSQRGIHLVPRKEWICDIIEWVTWKELANQGSSGCEWGRGSAIVNKIPSEAKNVRLHWNRAMFSFKWLFDFPMVPELPSV